MKNKCLICGVVGGSVLDGVMLCVDHLKIASGLKDVEKDFDVARWAIKERSNSREQIHMRLSSAVHSRLKEIASVNGTTMQNVIEKLILDAK